MAIKGTHDFVIKTLSQEIDLDSAASILDIGAGQGALSAKLKASGLSVSACDLVPDQFDVPGVECGPCDESGILPFADGQFDAAVSVEVLEHIDGHNAFFAEAARVLKPGGVLLFTTPNILSLKSRFSFLLTGEYYSFGLLTPFTKDPVGQHISPFTLNRYAWLLSQHGLTVSGVAADKRQTTSILLSFILPFIWIAAAIKGWKNPLLKQQNNTTALFGRKLVVTAKKSSLLDQ